MKVAVTFCAISIAIVQVAPTALGQPSQPAKTEPPAAVAFKVTLVPLLKLDEQVPPVQFTPPGVETTAPPPVPVKLNCKPNCCRTKMALTVLASLSENPQVLLPVHRYALPYPADHPANTEPDAAVAEIVTAVPAGKVYDPGHVVFEMQLPPGAEVIVPTPLPAGAVVTV